MSVIAFLPAKGESNRVDSKNTRLIDGDPLFLRTLRKISEVSEIDETYLDTESEKIVELASEVNCRTIKRNPDLATNETDGNELLLNEANQATGDIYVQILGTSPFIEKETIRKSINKVKFSEHDSAVLVESSPEYLWEDGQPMYDLDNIPNSNDLSKLTRETMGLYVIEHGALVETERRIGRNPYLIEASSREAVDIDYDEDLRLAKDIARGMRESGQRTLRVLRHSLSSAIICDVLDEFGYDGYIGNYNANVARPIFGRAKTLELRELQPGENPEGIYEALQSYDRIVPGDIIVVENECAEFAYFGELNAFLSIREGAQGALINSNTRDVSKTTEIGFPVYAKGQTPNDIKGEGTVANMHKTIKINGTEIKPGDLVFADQDGAVVVPNNMEKDILSRAKEIAIQEKDVLSGISTGVPIDELIDEYGEF